MNNHTAQQFSSSVGSVVDVATPSTRKLRALGFLWAIIALSTLVLINYVIFDVFISDDPSLGTHPLSLLGAALMPFIGWFALGNAIQRFHASSTAERYFRAGPGGISVSLTDDGASATFRFSCKTVSFDLPWDQIRTWYPYVESINVIPTERSIVFENLKGEKVKVKTYHFAEKQKEIAASIDRARSLSAVEQTTATPTNQNDATETATSLPKGLAEASFEVKKKRDTLREIDLRAIPGSQRSAYVEKVADVLEAKIVSLCPTAAGYRYSRKRYRPFREWKDVLGIRLFVQHGLLSGYEIQIEPNDSECRTLTISMCPSSLITDIRRYLSMAAGLVFALISFKYLPEIQDRLGGFSELAPLVMLIMICAALGVFTGLLQAPISLVRLLVSDKQKEEVRKQQIKLGVQEVAPWPI